MNLRTRGAFPYGQILFALAVIGVGIVAVVIASGYSFGQLNDIGPGFFPVTLGLVMCLLGGILAVDNLRNPERTVPMSLAPIVLVPAGAIAWALLIERLGLVPATVALVALCGLADRPVRPVLTGIVAMALAFGGVVVFVYGFRLPFAAFSW